MPCSALLQIATCCKITDLTYQRSWMEQLTKLGGTTRFLRLKILPILGVPTCWLLLPSICLSVSITRDDCLCFLFGNSVGSKSSWYLDTELCIAQRCVTPHTHTVTKENKWTTSVTHVEDEKKMKLTFSSCQKTVKTDDIGLLHRWKIYSWCFWCLQFRVHISQAPFGNDRPELVHFFAYHIVEIPSWARPSPGTTWDE